MRRKLMIFVSCRFSMKLIVFEYKIIEKQYLATLVNISLTIAKITIFLRILYPILFFFLKKKE